MLALRILRHFWQQPMCLVFAACACAWSASEGSAPALCCWAGRRSRLGRLAAGSAVTGGVPASRFGCDEVVLISLPSGLAKDKKNAHINVCTFLMHPHGIFGVLGVASRAECSDLPRNQHWGLKQIFLVTFRFVKT